MRAQIDEILNFWFGELDEGFARPERGRLWWGGDADSDRAVAALFGRQVRQALNGELDHWSENPRGRLALILLLDQFTRMLFRGDGEAFAGDAQALRLCEEGLERQHDRALEFAERMFFYMPLEHAEQLAAQDRCVDCFMELLAEVPEHHKAEVQNALDYAHQHRDLIQRFGRFPHRNDALDRPSTPEELAYLNHNRNRWGQ
ncbi:DUF924 family protein [Marinobacterium arenosum]|uniref:DUF924 family protein n=1 Tax=Marinobacterium arenosum TaxID=2862496 RepID=UPI001C95EAD7|nr:DUF924 family protein [Marinobacterium arenosum]MBY4675825.1 DUF924 domain-containing protein [Marinobacterium arenosum]